jgi:hypothetical protein
MPIAENQASIFYYTEKALKIKPSFCSSPHHSHKNTGAPQKSIFLQQLISKIIPTGLLTFPFQLITICPAALYGLKAK